MFVYTAIRATLREKVQVLPSVKIVGDKEQPGI